MTLYAVDVSWFARALRNVGSAVPRDLYELFFSVQCDRRSVPDTLKS